MTALHCTAPPHNIALYCTAFHCTALHCTALHCTALHFTTLHCTVLHCTALHFTTLHCTVLHCTALHCTALHCTARHCTAQMFSVEGGSGGQWEAECQSLRLVIDIRSALLYSTVAKGLLELNKVFITSNILSFKEPKTMIV